MSPCDIYQSVALGKFSSNPTYILSMKFGRCATSDVLCLRYWLQVVWVAARRVGAQVIKLHSIRYCANDMRIHDAMRKSAGFSILGPRVSRDPVAMLV
jgi:hypothetical protein